MPEKIEPALSAEEWKEAARHYFRGFGSGIDWNTGYLDCTESDFSGPMAFAVIALANARIPESDPRKITRYWVELLRSEAKAGEYADRVGDNAGFREDTATLRRIADALESYLPPLP